MIQCKLCVICGYEGLIAEEGRKGAQEGNRGEESKSECLTLFVSPTTQAKFRLVMHSISFSPPN